jgi:hypothetical protein
MIRPVLMVPVLLLAFVALIASPANAADNRVGTGYGTTGTGPGSLPPLGAPVPPLPGFNSFGWSHAKNGGYGASFSPSGGYGAAAGPSYNTGAGPATATVPNYALGFGASNGTLSNPGPGASGAGSTLGAGTNQNSATSPNTPIPR